MDKFEFTPKKGFEDASAYPDPISESETREQLMRPSKQLAEYINSNVVTSITALTGATGDAESIKQIQDMLNGFAKLNHVEISKADYDALSDSEKKNGSVYFIGD
jgi:hypothetical protein